MSQEEHIRQQVREKMRDLPDLNKVAPHEVDSYWKQQVINSEIENQRRRDEERRRTGF